MSKIMRYPLPPEIFGSSLGVGDGYTHGINQMNNFEHCVVQFLGFEITQHRYSTYIDIHRLIETGRRMLTDTKVLSVHLRHSRLLLICLLSSYAFG